MGGWIGQKRPLLISEYAIDREGFVEVDSKLKLVSFSGNGSKTVDEKLYTVAQSHTTSASILLHKTA